MKLSVTLLVIAISLGVILFLFQPKNVVGPRVKSVPITEEGFPYQELDKALAIAFPKGEINGPRYDLLRAQPEALDRYLGLISEIGPRSAPHRFTRSEQRLAYLLNAYTAGLLSLIRDACPIESVDDPYWFKGLFWRVSLRVGGEETSLNELISEINALMLSDRRAFLASYKGYKSDIPLRKRAWTPEEIELGFNELEEQLNQSPFVQKEGEILKLSALFQWYEHSFDPDPKGYLKRRHPELFEGVKQVIFMPADLSLQGRCSP
jgi:hypothetical protein